MFKIFSLLLLISTVSSFSGPKVPTKHAKQYDRRNVIQTTISSAMLVLGGNPAPSAAAYLDPNTDPPVVTKRVYLDVQIGDKEPGRLTIGLFGELMPKTVDNFEQLCSTNSYAGTTFYRVLSDFTIQGGAIGDPTGKTGKSAFGSSFEPDNYRLMHTKKGLVSMVRSLSGGVDSRFFINCNDDAGWADDKYAAFGIVEDGMDYVKKIEKVSVSPPKNSPKTPVTIIGCGVLNNA
mmetsp:Transcript_19465/g.28658  ORF Transcript_19465/g.28658 Transcript_19465/m.28658 type:complete len:234 (-) Transcript_19465:290-991(-)